MLRDEDGGSHSLALLVCHMRDSRSIDCNESTVASATGYTDWTQVMMKGLTVFLGQIVVAAPPLLRCFVRPSSFACVG